MGQLIRFSEESRRRNEAGSPHQAGRSQSVPEGGAKVLLFTGVRYERMASLPSERLAVQPLNRR